MVYLEANMYIALYFNTVYFEIFFLCIQVIQSLNDHRPCLSCILLQSEYFIVQLCASCFMSLFIEKRCKNVDGAVYILYIHGIKYINIWKTVRKFKVITGRTEPRPFSSKNYNTEIIIQKSRVYS